MSLRDQDYDKNNARQALESYMQAAPQDKPVRERSEPSVEIDRLKSEIKNMKLSINMLFDRVSRL